VLALIAKIFGSRNQRLLKEYAGHVQRANAFEPALERLSDGDLAARTAEFRARLKDGATVDDLLPEAFAVVREAARRTLRMRHFDMQLVGGIALHQGKISEMRTGEGKTLVATLPAYLNALSGKGVHVVTVNEYLAQRDADWMGPVFRFLGMSVGVIKNGQSGEEKRAAYAADITYGTNNEYGFDYLRDNLAFRLEDRVQRGLAYAIVDEVDSILIDEARTPLIISGPAEESTELYVKINALVPRLKLQKKELPEDSSLAANLAHKAQRRKARANGEDVGGEAGEVVEPGDYTLDEKHKQAHLTEQGHERVEQLMAETGLLGEGESLYDPANIRLMHHLNAALRAHAIYKRDVEYIVRNGEVVIVDEFTGRTMPGRRWSDGLHQAIEAKEGVKIREENQTIASITFQNYFRMYGKLAGMTGTADTEAYEFQQIYGLEVVVIPTHKPMIRADASDLVYLTKMDKFTAIVEDIRDCVARKQPALVGTTSIETSEFLSDLLTKQDVAHEVLNAKQHAREAEIVAQAGRPGAITIATNMAGRGTDIVLGGNVEAEITRLGAVDEPTIERMRTEWRVRHAEVVAAGGLHIVGTERHESRRIDNQLRGRSGRQGDPGSSRFYLSLEDNLMRIFGDPERTKALLSRVGMKAGEVIESRLLTRQIEKAQRKVEAHNFDMRKHLLEYDDVANEQRKVIYQQRTELMAAADVRQPVRDIREEVVALLTERFVPAKSLPEQWDLEGLAGAVEREFGLRVDLKSGADSYNDEGDVRKRIVAAIEQEYERKAANVGEPVMRAIEKQIMLQQLDQHWREHLAALDYLRQGIGWRSLAGRKPEQEYKREAFDLFSNMLDRIKGDTISLLSRIQVRSQAEIEREEEERHRRLARAMQLQHAEAPSAVAPPPQLEDEAEAGRGAQLAAAPFVRSDRKVGRNEPCPCGSGRKFKHCHGALA
jgi:preprotein translocase subunit SecA